MKIYRLGSFTALTLVFFVTTGAAFADPRGLWLAQDGARVRVRPCGQGFCGIIASAKSRLDPETGRPWTDKHNPDAARRVRPLVGVEVFSMMPDGPGRWSGPLYNVDNGQTYPGHLVEPDRDTLRVEACVIGVCGGQNMRRIR